MRPFVVPLLAVALSLAACGGDTSADDDDQGVRGIVLLGPICPVVTQASPCPDEPLPGVEIRVFGDGTELDASATSGSDGRFELRLPPGTYTLEAVVPEDGPGMSAQPVDVIVERGSFVEVTVPVDSGIREPVDTSTG